MIIKNQPSELTQLKDDIVCEFDDDSRLIYIHNSNGDWNEISYRIAVYDIVYNKFAMLSPDDSVNDILSTINYFIDLRPKIHIVSFDTLLILFKESRNHDIQALLILVKLNFCEKSWSLLDSKMYKDCTSAFIVKNEDKYLLLHEFNVGEGRDEQEYLAYYSFILKDDRISEFQGNRVVFDFNYDNTGRYFLWHVYDNKLWFFRRKRVEIRHQVSYFDLSEASPKEIPVLSIKDMYDLMFQWSDGRLLRYNQAEAELSYLNLDDNHWSKIYRCNKLRKLQFSGSNFLNFWKFNTFGNSFNYFKWHFEKDFKAILINVDTKQLIKIPFNEPHKLLDIAWTNVLNFGLLEELDRKGIVIFSKIF